jgi:steroid delta-isomerase-like uncharacterized protein
MSSIEQNTAAVRGFFDTARHGDLDALDAIVSPDYVIHDPSLPREFRGVEGAKELVAMYRSALGGLRVTIEHQFAEGDYVTTRFTARGTHAGDMLGVPPTGREVEISGITISRCQDGKVVEEWEICDLLGVLRQIGAVPELVES